MKENLIEENKINIENIETISDEENLNMFYFSQTEQIPNRIKEDFKKYQNFLLIFVNPKSGSKQGLTVLDHVNKYKLDSIKNFNIMSFPVNISDSSLIKPPQELLDKENGIDIINNNNISMKSEIKFDPLIPFSIIVFNIINKDEMNLGKKFIKKYLSDFPEFKIKILIAGGDGTVLGIVEDLNKENIDLNRCIFGSMPFGTGNDLSHALGFGSECTVGDINNFQRVLFTYLIGVESKIDIWELTLDMNKENGAIYDVIKDGEKLKEDKEKNKILTFKKTFVNYFSLGFDARVGFQFEQRRTSSRCCNKFVYAIEGAKRILCCKKNYGLTQLLDGFLEGNNNININNNNSNTSENEINIITEKSDSDLEEVPNEPLPLLNEKITDEDINNISNDKRFVFKTKKSGKTSHLGIEQEEASKEDYREYKRQVYENFKKQAFDDKKIEFLTFDNGFEFGLERFARGLAKRVYQGPGPVFLEFKKEPDDTERVALTKVYINCDGEFYHLQNPNEISVRLNENICNGQINILRNIKGL